MMNPEELLVGAEELEKLLAQVRDFATKYTSDGQTEGFPPHFFVLSKEPEKGQQGLSAYMLAMDFNTEREKRAILERIGRDVWSKKIIPVAVVLVSEAWMVHQKGEGPHPQPKDDPRRQEALVAFGQTAGARHAAITRSIITREQGKIRLGPWEQEPPEEVRTPILDYFFMGFFEHVKYDHRMGS